MSWDNTKFLCIYSDYYYKHSGAAPESTTATNTEWKFNMLIWLSAASVNLFPAHKDQDYKHLFMLEPRGTSAEGKQDHESCRKGKVAAMPTSFQRPGSITSWKVHMFCSDKGFPVRWDEEDLMFYDSDVGHSGEVIMMDGVWQMVLIFFLPIFDQQIHQHVCSFCLQPHHMQIQDSTFQLTWFHMPKMFCAT